jgi:hypothetical protein
MTAPEASAEPDQKPGLVRRLAGEPLLQFLLLGALLFLVSAGISHWRSAAADHIVIDPALVQWQRNLYRAQFGAWPDSEALEALIQRHIRDEALYREAVRLGLGADDEVIRQRLAQKMEFVLTDATLPPEPDEAMLQQFLDEHAELYSDSGRASFQLLYFADTPDMAGGRARASQALQSLAADATDVQGDAFALDEHWSAASTNDLLRRFGESEMAAAPFGAPQDERYGPYRTGYGWHQLRVTSRAGAGAPDRAAVRELVRADWLEDFRQRELEARITELIGKHRIVRQDGEAAR